MTTFKKLLLYISCFLWTTLIYLLLGSTYTSVEVRLFFRPSLRKPSSLIWSKGQNHSTKVHNASWKRRGFYSFSTRGLSNAFYIVKMSGWVTSCNSPVVNWHRAAKTETIFARRSNLNAKDWAWRVVGEGRVRSNSWQ